MPRLARCLPLLPCLVLAGPALAHGDLCLTGDFDAFFARFSHEIIVQEASTADPLALEMIDPTAEPEPELITSQIPLAEVEWPVIPDFTIGAAENVRTEVSDTPEGGKAVLMRGIDNGIRTTWVFAPTPCWQLVKVIDESM